MASPLLWTERRRQLSEPPPLGQCSSYCRSVSLLDTPPTQPVAFGLRLRTLREAAGLTQEELAEKAALTAYAVSALERGRRLRPYPHTVRSLADALQVSDEDRALLLSSIPPRTAPRPRSPEPPAPSASSAPADVSPRPGLRSGAGDGRAPLPAAGIRLLGRDEELVALRRLLLEQDRRLVTLTGTGGVGKTSLAASLAAQVAPAFPDGVAVVSLAPLADPASVMPSVALAVGSPVLEGPDAARHLTEHLHPLRFLLVLDNLEHLLAAAEQVADLVARCPRLVVLVTSRAPLRVRDETEFPVQPLAVPAEAVRDPARVQACAAVAVFVDRARSVAPAFDVNDGNAAAVAALCRRLAGIPLALELAAARLRFLTPQALLSRLDDAMARAGGPDLPARQRTLRATFDWSYDLLAPAEQRLLLRLSVFCGGATLDALEDVSAQMGEQEAVLPSLEVLVEHSLVVAGTDRDGDPRFGLLEPVAQYARSRQTEAESAQLRAAHAACFLRLAERAAPEYLGAEQVTWLDRAEHEDANLTAALTWSLQSGDGETAGRLCWALWLFWWLRGRLLLGFRSAEQALELDMPPEVRTRTINTAAAMAFALGDLETAGSRWRQAEAMALEGPDRYVRAGATAGVGLVALAEGELTAAERQFRRALRWTEEQGVYGDWLQSLIHVWLGTVGMVTGELAGSVVEMQAGLTSARRRGDRLTAYVALYNLSQVAIAQGDHGSARNHLHEGVRLTEQTGDVANLAYFLEALAVVERATGDPRRVGVLVGAASAVRELTGTHVYGYYKPDEALLAASAAQALALLGEDAYGDALDAGRRLTPDGAIAYALSDTDASSVD